MFLLNHTFFFIKWRKCSGSDLEGSGSTQDGSGSDQEGSGSEQEGLVLFSGGTVNCNLYLCNKDWIVNDF